MRQLASSSGVSAKGNVNVCLSLGKDTVTIFARHGQFGSIGFAVFPVAILFTFRAPELENRAEMIASLWTSFGCLAGSWEC